MRGVFRDNEGHLYPNSEGFQIDADTFVFGAVHDNWFKMACVDRQGRHKECRYMTASQLDFKNMLDSVRRNWNAANRGGAYTVQVSSVAEAKTVTSLLRF